MFQWKYFVKFFAALRANLLAHGSYYTLRSAITSHSPAPLMNQLQDDYGFHPAVHFFLSLFLISSCSFCCSPPPTQFPSSTSATQTTTWTRATATWRCRCGGRAPISPRQERSQFAPGRRIRFQLRVRMCLLQFELIHATGGGGSSHQKTAV